MRSHHPVSRRTLLAGVTAAVTAARALDLPQSVRVLVIGTEGHTGEVTGPAKLHREIQILETVPSGKDYRPRLDALKPDVVAVCTHDGARAAAILACIERRLPFIAEKPFAMRLDDLARIRQGVEQHQLKMTIMLPLRFTPHFQALRQIVASGEIGEVAQIEGQKSYKQGEPGWKDHAESFSGIIPWVGIHMLDLMRWTSGREFVEAASFQSRLAHPEIGVRENTAAALFRLDNGGVATLRMDYLRPNTAPTHEDDRLRLAGTKGVAEYQASTGVTVIPAVGAPRRVDPLPAARHLFVEFLRHLYQGAPEPISRADIFRTNEIVLKTRDAANSSRVIKL